LMDEPLSSLPPDFRLQLRHDLVKLHMKRPRPLLYVTHDHEDALALGQRVAVLHDGRIQQIGTPREIYERPANRFVAGFIGKPAMNFLPARDRTKAAETIGVRPEHFEICGSDGAWLSATVESVHYGGAYSDIVAHCDSGSLIVRASTNGIPSVGDSIRLRARDEHVHFFDSAGKRIES
jgi:multiple sugar transport system ATP-binding protein